MSAVVADSAIAPARTGAQQAVAAPEKAPRANTDAADPVRAGFGTFTGSIVPRQSPTATKSIITPPRTKSCACQSLTGAARAIAPSGVGRTTNATPATYSGDSRATLRGV